MPFSWRCPFCSHNATIGDANQTALRNTFNNGNKYGIQSVWWRAIACPNPKCREYTFEVAVSDYIQEQGQNPKYVQRYHWKLVPAAEMKVFPDYVPAAIVADYKEACAILSPSPKASATLARRCLQGMIRDYWTVKPGRLFDEIEAIHNSVHPRTWDAIDAVRKIGNIGAHMEKDIDVIVDVEPDEAKLLIGLIETLVDDWYVTRHERESRVSKIVDAVKKKELMRRRPESEPDRN